MEVTIRAWTGKNEEVDFQIFEVPDEAEHLSVHVDREQVAALRIRKASDAIPHPGEENL